MAKLILSVSVVLALLVALGACSPRPRCCTKYHDNPVPVKFFKYYTIQDRRHFCNIDAVIFKMLNNRIVCANPDSKWVQDAVEIVPKKPGKA